MLVHIPVLCRQLKARYANGLEANKGSLLNSLRNFGNLSCVIIFKKFAYTNMVTHLLTQAENVVVS
jgi:hypothetical protein